MQVGVTGHIPLECSSFPASTFSEQVTSNVSLCIAVEQNLSESQSKFAEVAKYFIIALAGIKILSEVCYTSLSPESAPLSA